VALLQSILPFLTFFLTLRHRDGEEEQKALE
jgi:hypothetical protein